MKTGERLRTQRSRYDHRKLVRLPEWLPGAGTLMEPRTYQISAAIDGILKVRRSKINPEKLKYVEVDPDIQKDYRSTQLRAHFAGRGEAFPIHPRQPGKAAMAALHQYQEPDWRLRVMKNPPPRERFIDPNLFARGLISTPAPIPEFNYE